MSNTDPTTNLPAAPAADDPNAALGDPQPTLDTSMDAIPADMREWFVKNIDQVFPSDTPDPAPAAPAPTTADPAGTPGAGTSSSADASAVPPSAEGTTTAVPPAPVPGDDVPPPTDADAPQDLPAAASLTVQHGGTDFTVTPEIATELLSTYAWVTDPARQQLFQVTAAIEAGEAVALSRQDYDTLLDAAKRGVTPATTPPPVAPQIPKVDVNNSLDPDLARAFNALADLVAAQQPAPTPQAAPQAQVIPQPAPLFDPVQAQQQAELQQRADAITGIHQQYAQRYGLSELEAQRLMEVATASGDVARAAQLHAQRTPHLPFHIEGAVAQAFDRALVTDASLRARYEATLRSAPAAAPTPAAPVTQPAPATNKKANAGTLASLSSAATPAATRDPRQMTDQEVQAWIAAELTKANG